MPKNLTISDAIQHYLTAISASRAEKTIAAYKNGLAKFQEALTQNGLPPGSTPLETLPETALAWLAQLLKAEWKWTRPNGYISPPPSVFSPI